MNYVIEVEVVVEDQKYKTSVLVEANAELERDDVVVDVNRILQADTELLW